MGTPPLPIELPVITGILYISVTLVFWDITRNKIGHIPESTSRINLSAESWAFHFIIANAVCSLGNMIITPLSVLPYAYYLRIRSKLLTAAKNNPVETSHKYLKMLAIFTITTLQGILAYYWVNINYDT